MKALLYTLSALALSFAAAGCGPSGGKSDGGSDGSGGTCGVDPCGGDVIGNWTASSACEDQATLSAEFLAHTKGSCPTASLGVVSLLPTGMLTLAADMTFTGNVVTNATVNVNFPSACVMNSTCATLQQTLQVLVGTSGITAVTCAGTDSCVCTILQTIDIVNASGTFATSGTTMTFAGVPGADGPYCVQGSSLHLIGLDLATNTKVSNEIVLIKQ
jgi:hypothetical protein